MVCSLCLSQATGGKVLLVSESGTVVPLLTSAACAPQRPSPAGAGNASHSVIPMTVKLLTTTNDAGNVGPRGFWITECDPSVPSQFVPNRSSQVFLPDPWLEACVYACARLLSMAMHTYTCLHPNTPHACVRLGSGTQRWTSCIVMHRFSAEKKFVLVEFLFKSTVCRKGT